MSKHFIFILSQIVIKIIIFLPDRRCSPHRKKMNLECDYLRRLWSELYIRKLDGNSLRWFRRLIAAGFWHAKISNIKHYYRFRIGSVFYVRFFSVLLIPFFLRWILFKGKSKAWRSVKRIYTIKSNGIYALSDALPPPPLNLPLTLYVSLSSIVQGFAPFHVEFAPVCKLQIYIVQKFVVCLFVFRLDNSEKLETIEIHRK